MLINLINLIKKKLITELKSSLSSSRTKCAKSDNGVTDI